jgi:hypothetical protein
MGVTVQFITAEDGQRLSQKLVDPVQRLLNDYSQSLNYILI